MGNSDFKEPQTLSEWLQTDIARARQLESAQRDAQKAKRGLWSKCTVQNGQTLPVGATAAIATTTPAVVTTGLGGVAPIDEITCPAGAPIKGNVNSKKEKIYHVPGSRDYDKTEPETCFATEDAAKAAGFRAPRR